MAAAQVRFLDLDKIVADVPPIEIGLGGKNHRLKLTSVRDWIINTKAMQEVKSGDDLAQLEATCQQINRSFPTADIEDIRNLTMDQLGAIVDFVRGVNGTTTLDEGVKAAVVETVGAVASTPDVSATVTGGDIGSENPPTAG